MSDFDGEGDVVEEITRVRIVNPNIQFMDQDILYHLGLGSGSHDLCEMFGDVKFVCMGGTPKRMQNFANYLMSEIDYKIPTGTSLHDISQHSYRYSMYKVGPVLSVSHGMGNPSIGILLHELIKLMHHARVVDPVFIRMGTCGGIGLESGTVVFTEEAVDACLKPFYELRVLGKITKRPAILDSKLTKELQECVTEDDPYQVASGKTMAADDFYEGQARLDGAFCEFSEMEKTEYLEKLRNHGVVNIEMESTVFAALTHHANIRAAIVCVTLLDRLKGDQINHPKEVLEEWQSRPQLIVGRYIKKYLQTKKSYGSLSKKTSNRLCGYSGIKSPRRFKLTQQESESYE